VSDGSRDFPRSVLAIGAVKRRSLSHWIYLRFFRDASFERSRTLAALASGVSLLGAAAAAISDWDRGAVVFLACAQTFGVLWLFLEGWGKERRWRSATCLVASAWIPLFLVAAWVYTFSPRLLAEVAPSPEPALSVLSLSLFAAIATWLALEGRAAISRGRLSVVDVDPQCLCGRWLLTYIAVGLLGIVAFMMLTGGPVKYVTHLSESGGRSSGLVYVIWMALFLKYSGLTLVGYHWTSGKGRRSLVVGLACSIVLLLSLFGQRAFLALMLVQAVLLYSLVRKPLLLRLIVPCAVLTIVLITFGIGTVKRYQGYRDSVKKPRVTFITYVRTTAAHEFVRAYINNYADGVRLIARARELVPKEAGYEKGRGLVRLALQPIPSFLRPEVHVAKPLRPLLESSGGNTYALPIPLAAYVELGLLGVVLGGVFLAGALVVVDRNLAKDHQTLSGLLVLTAAAVEVPFCLRNSLPRGIAFGGLDLLGMFIVAKTCLRGSARGGPRSNQSRSPKPVAAAK
jgi:hypothetical protein